ncbi:MBL fold metallo-hydrolase [candidate division KSB1 bacterium]|nr:MAG: MBL fold metallo-hydrolase [candidate division KSB1 bacterium]
MKIKTLVLSPFQTNCYILSCEKTNEGIVIDPADEGETIAGTIKELKIRLKYVLITHAHLDHIMGLLELKNNISDLIAMMDKKEKGVLKNLPYQAAMFGMQVSKEIPVIDKFVKEGDIIKFGEETLSVIELPGHSPGGIGFMGKKMVFVGDTLFQGSIGRTDLYGGSYEKLIDSIKTKLFTLNDDIIVYPGHGPATTIGNEKKNNPFFTEEGFFRYI